jgi:hypothetical protein
MTFEPINTQEEFDKRIKGRLARERERWEKESGHGEAIEELIEELRSKVQAKDMEMAGVKRIVAIDNELGKRGVPLERRGRIRRLVNLDTIEVKPGEDPSPDVVAREVDTVASEIPELFRVPGPGAGSGGSARPVLPREKPALTRSELEGMSQSQINKRWDEVQNFLSGENGGHAGSAGAAS